MLSLLLKFTILTFLLLNISLVKSQFVLDETISPNCTNAREIFANASSKFIKCSIEFSRPITFCENCIAKYINVLSSYHNMSLITNNGTPCINYFVNNDRLGIVQTLYENSVNLWNRAKCYECFELKNGTITPYISNQTVTFLELFSNFSSCQNNTEDEAICAICDDEYQVLQDYFFSISNENEKIGVCMDIVDMMNSTWTYWGNKCCKFRRHKEYGFIFSTVAVLVTTVLFYIIAQIYAKKKQPTIVEQTRFLNTLET
ncbi:unnamed protein product [Ceutorhynchus assimilis]|uniref:Osteopetrosis-associated transmembrane protein 1 n=1 Tax=Ceutorhynchus assimilis TaxID=467358 RepID=A0A9N9QR44_9CUCU|nr:unnamed protein product [Ceutorhynchus assimilis]